MIETNKKGIKLICANCKGYGFEFPSKKKFEMQQPNIHDCSRCFGGGYINYKF
jgi:DnaJ-class molecular chaperone